jgi:hypothetical protein
VSSSNSTEVRGRAFGLALEADFDVPGLPPGDSPELPRLALRLVDEAAIARRWPAGEATCVSAGPGRSIDMHPSAGFRLYARYFGLALLTAGGDTLLCAPPPVAYWRWQRFAVGRCMPLAALLRGYEVFHAGAVAVDGGVVGIVGPRAAGKTSLILHLALEGASFFTDDVLAVDVASEDLVAHPGFGVMNVRTTEYERLSEAAHARLGEPLGQTGHRKLHIAVRPQAGPLPLRALLFLTPGAGGESTVRRLTPVDPARLLSSTFIHESRSPEQLARLLDVCARISTEVPVFEVVRGDREDAHTLAARLRDRLWAGVAT